MEFLVLTPWFLRALEDINHKGTSDCFIIFLLSKWVHFPIDSLWSRFLGITLSLYLRDFDVRLAAHRKELCFLCEGTAPSCSVEALTSSPEPGLWQLGHFSSIILLRCNEKTYQRTPSLVFSGHLPFSFHSWMYAASQRPRLLVMVSNCFLTRTYLVGSGGLPWCTEPPGPTIKTLLTSVGRALSSSFCRDQHLWSLPLDSWQFCTNCF